jgi:hypothetical protein
MTNESDRMSGNGTALFCLTAAELLLGGRSVRFSAPGHSMQPAIRPSDVLHVAPIRAEELSIGDIALYRSGSRILAHRVVDIHPVLQRSVPNVSPPAEPPFQIIFKGDACVTPDPPVSARQILGKVIRVEPNGCRMDTCRPSRRLFSFAAGLLSRLSLFFRRACS